MIKRRKAPPLSSLQKDIFEILTFQFKASKIPIEEEIFIFQNNYNNQYSKTQQSTFSIKVNESTIKESLIDIGFQIPFDLNIITSIRSTIFNTPQQITNIIAFEIFTQSLAYYISDEKNDDKISKLFSIFPQMLEYSQYHDKIISVYTLILEKYSQQKRITDFMYKSISLFLNFFLEKKEKLPETFSDAFFSYIKLNKEYNMKITAISDLFKLIISFQNENILFFTITENEKFFDILRPFIKKLHTQGINLLHFIATLSNDYNEHISSLYKTMAEGLGQIIIQNNSDDQKNVFIEQSLTEIPELNELSEIKYKTVFKKIPKIEYKENEITSFFTFSDSFQISLDFTPNLIQNYLKIVSNALCGVNKQYLDAFIEKIIEKAKQDDQLFNYADFFSIIIFFANQIELLNDNIIQFLMSPIIFHSSKFSSFIVDSDNPCYYYYYLRYSVFSLILKKQGQLKGQFINNLLIFSAKMSPFIYSEILLYVLKNLSSFSKICVFCDDDQILSLFHVMIELQNLYSMNENEIENDPCRVARIVCLDFLFKLFDDSESFSIIISNRNFSKGIVNLLFEQSLSNLIINKLTKAVINFNIDLNNLPFFSIVHDFSDILVNCTKNKDDSQFKELGTMIINSIIESVKNNLNIVLVYCWLFYYILIFVKETQDVTFIDDIFEFFLITLTHIIRYEISENIFNVFVDFMNQILIEKNELTEKVFLLFLGLLAGKKIDHLKPFVIKYHQVIPLFVCSFSKYDNFTEILSIFNELCHYSPANCIACHDGELDHILIQFIQKKLELFYRKKIGFKFDIDQNYSLIIEIISQIISNKTSTSICDEFIQMLIPSSSSYQEKDVKTNLILLWTIVNDNLNKMKPILDLVTDQTLCEIDGFTDEHMNNDFLFSFELKIDVPQMIEFNKEFIIAEFRGVDNTYYKFYIKPNNENAFMNIEMSNANGKKEIQTDKELKSNEWILISFIQQKSDPQFMEFYINNDIIKKFSTNIFQFKPGKVSLTIGTSSSNRNLNLKIGEIGPFIFSNSRKLTESKNFDKMEGVYLSSMKILNPEIQKDFEIKNLSDFEDKNSLNNVLIEFDLNHLTDFFSEFEIDDPNLLFTFLKIILSLLSSSSHSSQHNYKSVLKLCQTISKLFGQKIDLKIYLEIFSTFEKLICKELAYDFFKDIIFNMNIWCMADMDSILNIIQNLIEKSKGKYSNYFNNFVGIPRLLAIFKLSFIKDNTKVEKIDGYNDSMIYPFQKYHSKSEIEKIKEKFFNFIVERGKSSLNYNDIKAIYFHLLASESKTEKIDLLVLISRLNLKILQILGENVNTFEFDLISPIFKIIGSTTDVDIIINSIKTIRSLSSETVHLHNSIISMLLIKHSNISEIYSNIRKLADEDLDIYSLVCSLALLRGDESVISASNLIEKLCSDELFDKILLDDCFMWAIWPICLSLTETKSQRSQVVNFLFRQMTRKDTVEDIIQNFIDIYYLIDFMNEDSKLFVYKTQSELTYKLFEFISGLPETEVKINFLIHAFTSIFFHPCPHLINLSLAKLFVLSPFFTGPKNVSFDNGNQKKNIKNFDDIYYGWDSSRRSSSNKETNISLGDKAAQDYSGIRTEANELGKKKFMTQSSDKLTKNAKPSVFSSDLLNDSILNDNMETNGNEGEPPARIHNESSIVSFIQLLEFVEQTSQNFSERFVFQLKFDYDEKWIDFDLCGKLIEFSNSFLPHIKGHLREIELISKFRLICDGRKKKSSLKEFDDLIPKIGFDSYHLLSCLGKAVDKGRRILNDENNFLLHFANDEYMNDMQIELAKINRFNGFNINNNDSTINNDNSNNNDNNNNSDNNNNNNDNSN